MITMRAAIIEPETSWHAAAYRFVLRLKAPHGGSSASPALHRLAPRPPEPGLGSPVFEAGNSILWNCRALWISQILWDRYSRVPLRSFHPTEPNLTHDKDRHGWDSFFCMSSRC